MTRFSQKMPLRTRITVAFVLQMAAVLAFIVLAEQVDYDKVRAYSVAKSLQDEVRRLQAEIAQGAMPKMPQGSQLYSASNVPEGLRDLAPGYHSLPGPDGGHLQVFLQSDQRYYLLQGNAYFDYLEYWIDGFVFAVFSICILFAFWIGRITAAQVIAPITRLAQAVQQKQKPFPFLDAPDEMGVLARAFSQHSDELEQFLQREQLFVGDTSHELRTPLAIIGGAAETIAYQLPEGSTLAASAARIVRTTQEMERQLSCLLLLSRNPHSIAKQAVPMCALIEECMARCQPWLAGKPVSLILDAPREIRIHANPELARSVIWNLLRNACQYTEQGTVHIGLQELTLVVSDTGPGLPASIHLQPSTRFSHQSSERGEGLGLALVHRIVEHLGWQMTVDSSPMGSRFTLCMELRRRANMQLP